MQSLNHLISQGKILYIGVSDTPAWVVAKANEYARNHGLRQFSVYQGRWSAATRDFEREIIPMTRAENMGLVPFGVLGSGAFKTEEQRRVALGGRGRTATGDQIRISRELETIVLAKGGNSDQMTSVALAYILHKAPYVFPVIGMRKVEHLRQSIKALTLHLTDEEIDRIEGAVPFDLGFPHNLLWNPAENGGRIPANPADVWLSRMSGNMDYVPLPKPIRPPGPQTSPPGRGREQ
jgi:aryl-alcohol dehydrogenase-like predicted oxidoreductase